MDERVCEAPACPNVPSFPCFFGASGLGLVLHLCEAHRDLSGAQPLDSGCSVSGMADLYPPETLSDDVDDGTIVDNVATLAQEVVGHRIVKAERVEREGRYGYGVDTVLEITLDNGKVVELHDTDDCCAYTALEGFLLNPELVDHIIMGVGTTDGYSTWHIYADWGDILALEVGWSSGNPFYYGYGFDIRVREPAASVHDEESLQFRKERGW